MALLGISVEFCFKSWLCQEHITINNQVYNHNYMSIILETIILFNERQK